jgi:hypothetical protein
MERRWLTCPHCGVSFSVTSYRLTRDALEFGFTDTCDNCKNEVHIDVTVDFKVSSKQEDPDVPHWALSPTWCCWRCMHKHTPAESTTENLKSAGWLYSMRTGHMFCPRCVSASRAETADDLECVHVKGAKWVKAYA